MPDANLDTLLFSLDQDSVKLDTIAYTAKEIFSCNKLLKLSK
jgi:hypothetical protein